MWIPIESRWCVLLRDDDRVLLNVGG